MPDSPESDRPAPRAPRIYTRQGDAGVTRLASGRKVPKNHPRLCAYGTLDELQVAIGAARDALAWTLAEHPGRELPDLESIGQHLIYFQHLLFKVSADLAMPLEERRPGALAAGEDDVRYLEALIDRFTRDLPPLREFILPGGHPAVTALHFCRVVCRRGEREVEALASTEELGEGVRPLINRLSDAFFVLARRVRWELEHAGVTIGELPWRKDLPPPSL